MVIALWILNSLLALAFLAAGMIKLFRAKNALATSGMAWTDDFSAASVKAIGVAEILGAVGLILPLWLMIAPVLTPLAASGLVVLMAGAVATHVRRNEAPTAPALLGVLSVVSAVLGFLIVLT